LRIAHVQPKRWHLPMESCLDRLEPMLCVRCDHALLVLRRGANAGAMDG
jgi:hypothetical protein